MTVSGKKGFATDLLEAAPPSEETIEQVFESARRKIGNVFAASAVEVAENYVELATNPAVDEDVRRKASDRILDTFLPTNVPKIGHIGGTTVQILNAIPIPEVRMIDGRPDQTLLVGGTPVAIPRRMIGPGDPDPKTRRQSFLGPAATDAKGNLTKATSPMPVTKTTNMPVKL